MPLEARACNVWKENRGSERRRRHVETFGLARDIPKGANYAFSSAPLLPVAATVVHSALRAMQGVQLGYDYPGRPKKK